jgi:hypothetical protein
MDSYHIIGLLLVFLVIIIFAAPTIQQKWSNWRNPPAATPPAAAPAAPAPSEKFIVSTQMLQQNAGTNIDFTGARTYGEAVDALWKLEHVDLATADTDKIAAASTTN